MTEQNEFNMVVKIVRDALTKTANVFKISNKIIHFPYYEKIKKKHSEKWIIQLGKAIDFKYASSSEIVNILTQDSDIQKFIQTFGGQRKKLLYDLTCAVSSLLVDHAISQATRLEEYDPLALPEPLLDKCSIEMANRIANKTKNISVLCTIKGLGNVPTRGTNVNLGNNICISIWNEHQMAALASKFLLWHSKLDNLFQCKLLSNNDGILNFKVQLSLSDDEIASGKKVQEEAYKNLDILKWSIQSIIGSDTVLCESTHIYYDPLNWLEFHGLQRFERERDQYGHPCITINKIDKEELARRFNLLQKYRKNDDIQAAIYFYSRACIANTPRDRLVEAIIGMERLLVDRGGDISFRFGLYGASILSGTKEEADENFKNFKSLYTERSNYVHGSEKKMHKLSDSTLTLFTKLIYRILTMLESGLIKPEDRLCKQIEGLVRKNSILFPQT